MLKVHYCISIFFPNNLWYACFIIAATFNNYSLEFNLKNSFQFIEIKYLSLMALLLKHAESNLKLL